MKKSSKCLLKRTLSVVLACVMVLSLFPTVAFAARLDREVAEIPAVDEAAAKLSESPAQPLAVDANPAGGRTYYVSIVGKGGNDGLSEANPLPGLDAVPWDQLQAGDRVLLKKGETFPGAIRMVDVHGTADAPITIDTYGTGSAPVIEARGQGIWLPKEGNKTDGTPGKYVSSGITLYDCSYITVTGLNIVNVPDTMKTSFIDVNGASDADGVSDHSGEKMTYSGIGVATSTAKAAEGITLTDITVRGDSSVVNVKTDQITGVGVDGVTVGTAETARTHTDASGTYYVSSRNGSDRNDGSTPEKAFYSLHKINELNLQPGAKVYLERGSVFENQYLHVNGGGSAAQPIIIDAYGSGDAPVINTNGNGVWYQNYRKNLDNANHLRHGYVSSSILLYDVPYVEIKNIAMTNFGRYGETQGADFENLGSYDGGAVPGETGYSENGNIVGTYSWGGKMSRTGVAGVAQNIGTVHHVYLQNLDIENIYGNVIYKHMNNGGIYFTTARPMDASTGVAKFDDVRMEGCYLKRVSRWGIAAGYTSYYAEVSSQAAISDEACRTYGMTNLYIGHNYLEEVGGDPITTMHAFEPLVEYNVSQKGGREMSGSGYMNSTPYKGNFGSVSAGIWPWKCKTALFEHNECYTMMYSNRSGGNNDAQPWDADSGDSTIYQYNYSAGNTGGCIMFCGGAAYNSVFRYNVSYQDGVPAAQNQNSTNRGILDFSSSPNGQVYNNTFIMAEGTPVYHYTTTAPTKVENNIFFNLGNPYTPIEAWNSCAGARFQSNIYVDFATQPNDDTAAITGLGKTDLFTDPTFADAPTSPKSDSKAGVRTVNGIRDWTHDWATEFDVFKTKSTAAEAINAALPHNYDCLSQDADFGVPRVANDKDFYGNALDEVHDIGAYDTQTVDPVVPDEPDSDNELKASLFELRNTSELHVPFTTNNPTTVEAFKKGLTVADTATVKVYSGSTEQADTAQIAADMTVKIVAEDGTESTAYTIKQKNVYNSQTDWVDAQQGNVWFYQYENNGVFTNQTNFGDTYHDWTGSGAVEQNQAVGNIDQSSGSGFTFRAPANGKVTVTFNYKAADDNAGKASTEGVVTGSIRKRAATPDSSWQTYLRTYHNDVEDENKAILIPMDSITAIPVNAMTFTVAQGDTLSFMIKNTLKDGESLDNLNKRDNHGVYYNPVITYENEAVTVDDTRKPTTPVGLRVSNVTDTTATVIWNASTDNVGVDHYEVSVNNGTAENTNELTKALTGLTENSEHTVTVKAVDTAGNTSGAASVTFRTAKTPDTEKPTAPTGGNVKSTTSTTATISWTAATDNVGVDHYEVTVNGKTVEVRNTTQVTLTGLTAGASGSASVVAVDAAGNESVALTISFTTAAADTTPPTVPANAAVTGISRNSAVVRWNPATDNESVAGYEIKLGASGEEIDVGNALQYKLTGLEAYTEYTVSVRAYDVSGNHSNWADVNFTTVGSGENELISSLFEIRDTDKLQVPYTDLNPVTVEEFQAAFEVSEGATMKVFNAQGVEVTEGNVTAGMTAKVVAQDGTASTEVYTIVQKNIYNSLNDWNDQVQGNVWFFQSRVAEDNQAEFNNLTGWDNTYNCWTGSGSSSIERNQASGSVNSKMGTGYTFRMPVDGMVNVVLTNNQTNKDNEILKRNKNGNTQQNAYDTYLIIYKNNEERDRIPLNTVITNGSIAATTTTPYSIALAQGDTLSFMATNIAKDGSDYGRDPMGGGVYFTPKLTYQDAAYVPEATGVSLNKTTAALNVGESVELSATVLPEGANQTVTWSIRDTDEDVIRVDGDGLVTAVGNGTAVVYASVDRGWGQPLTASCAVTVSTKITSITVMKDGTPVGNTPVKVYANETGKSVALTATVEPESASNKVLNWNRPDGAQGMISISERDTDGSGVTITAISDELNVGEVTVEVSSAADPEVKTSFTVHVIRALENDVYVTGEAKVGSTLTASTVDLVMKDAAKEKLKYQWYHGTVSEENKIAGATGKQYVISEDDIGAKLSVTVTADPDSFYEGTRTAVAEQAVALMDGPAAPTGLTAVQCVNGDDGKITGLDADKAYEYSADNGATWTKVTGVTEITGCPAGTYLVRFAATDTQEAGAAVTKTILPANETGHTISFNADPAEGGSIDVNKNPAVARDTVTITVTPKTGYRLVDGSLTVAHTADATQTVAVRVDNTFEMPAADVTVSAQFEKLTFEITHDIAHVKCSLSGDHTHTVEYGDQPVIVLTAEEGYTMPANVKVTITDTNTEFRGYTYSHKAATPDTATLTFTQGITEDLTISGTAPVKTYAVNYTLKNGLSAPEADASRTVNHKAAYDGTLVAENPAQYKLPLGVQITMGGTTFTDFTYNSETGMISIAAGKITGNLVIIAEGLDATVPVYPVTGVKLDRENASVQVGKSITLTAAVQPENATDQNVVWSSSDPAIATVNEEGKVTGIAEGTATITVTTVDGNRTATCTVTVTKATTGGTTGGSSSSTSTATETRDDGTTVTTVTKPDGSVTETVTQPDGTKSETVTTKDGDVTITVTDENGEELVKAEIPATIPEPETKFEDVAEAAPWAEEAIQKMAGLELVNGTGGNKYSPVAPMTRGSLATVLHRLSQGKTDYETTFKDVAQGKYYTEGVAWAAKAKVVTGYTTDIFAPDDVITREQLAVMLARYAKLIGMDTKADSKALDQFADGENTGSWAADGVAWCVENGILKGKGQNDLDPTANVTRAEVAVMLDRFIALIQK